MDDSQYRYDAFLSASSADREWADSWLLPRLRAAGLGICTEDDFSVGVARLINIERSIGASRHTLVVLTPAWLDSEWNDFEALLSQTRDPAGRRLRRTIPISLQPCELPPRLAMLSLADFTRAEQWPIQIERIIAAIRAGAPETQPASGAALGLAALPLDSIPDVAPLPPGSRMPLSRNPLFVGRADDLKALAATLKGGATAAIGQIAAATGLGGIGKTQLASEFVHCYGQFFASAVRLHLSQ